MENTFAEKGTAGFWPAVLETNERSVKDCTCVLFFFFSFHFFPLAFSFFFSFLFFSGRYAGGKLCREAQFQFPVNGSYYSPLLLHYVRNAAYKKAEEGAESRTALSHYVRNAAYKRGGKEDGMQGREGIL